MRQDGSSIGHSSELRKVNTSGNTVHSNDFVLEKSIFTNVFERDIRRIFIYKKTERLAKAIHLITPAFNESASLRNRIDAVAIALVDAAILPPAGARTALSRELLALSSILSIARTGGLLSPMNTDLILHEAHMLLQEVASYEEPRLFLEEAPTLSDLAKRTTKKEKHEHPSTTSSPRLKIATLQKGKGSATVKDTSGIKDRTDAILAVLRTKERASIKDISTVIRNVSEKTIQRELTNLILEGRVFKEGERRWSTYSLA
jgi:hypothetical protein